MTSSYGTTTIITNQITTTIITTHIANNKVKMISSLPLSHTLTDAAVIAAVAQVGAPV